MERRLLELLSDVAAATPLEMTEVGAVGDAEVLERDEETLVDRLPQAKLDRDTMVEPDGDVPSIEPLRGRGQAEQLFGARWFSRRS